MRLIDSQQVLEGESERGALLSEPLDVLAARVAEILASRDYGWPSPDAWLDAEAAAHYLGYSETEAGRRRGRQRIYDLVSQRRLKFAAEEANASRGDLGEVGTRTRATVTRTWRTARYGASSRQSVRCSLRQLKKV